MSSTENKTRHMAVTEEDLANVKHLKMLENLAILFYFIFRLFEVMFNPILECE